MKNIVTGIAAAGLLAVPWGAFGLELNNAYNTNLTDNVVVDSLVKNQGGTLSITNNGGVYTLTVTTAPTNINGIIPWAIINDSSAPGGSILNWAVANGDGNALSSLTNYNKNGGTNPSGYDTNVNVRPSSTLHLQFAHYANACILDNGVGIYPYGGGHSLTLTSGGFVQSGGISYIYGDTSTRIVHLYFGPTEALFHVLGTLAFSGNVSSDTDYQITGTAGMTKSGAGTMIFGHPYSAGGIQPWGPNVTGNFTINEGTVRCQSSSAKGLGATAGNIIFNGGSLEMASDAGLTYIRSNVVVGADVRMVSDKYTNATVGVTYTLGTLAMTNCTLTVAGGTNVNNGTAGLTFTGATTLRSSATFNVTNPVAGGTTVLTLGGAVGDGGNGYGFTKTGDGTLALSGSNTYSGDTTVSAGVLALTTNTCLHDGAALRIVTGAKVDLAAGVNETVKALYLDGQLKMAGTWGNTGSGADHEKPLFFSGSGILTSLTGTPKGTIMVVR